MSLFILSVLSSIFCSASSAGEASPLQPTELYAKDRLTLSQRTSFSGEVIDKNLNNAFSKIFGGPKADNIQNYLDERIKHVFNLTDISAIQMTPSTYMDYIQENFTSSLNENGLTVMALNLSSVLWSYSKSTSTDTVVLNYQNETIPISSMRSGVLVLGDYSETMLDGDQKKSPNPIEVRLDTLIHEARHSDCSGGLSRQYNFKYDANAFENFYGHHTTPGALPPERTCGHRHVRCPFNHPYSGLVACDVEVWGSYAISAIYALASVHNLPKDSVERSIMNVVAADDLSRIIVPYQDAILNSSPDMTSDDEM